MIQRLLIIIICLAWTFSGIALAQENLTSHTVQPGETLYGIAATNGMSVDELKQLNGISGDVIMVGQVLRLTPGSAGDASQGGDADIPPLDDQDRMRTAALEAAPDVEAALSARGITTHVTRRGETLYSIAADRGTKAYILFTLNRGVRAPLEPGTPVVVPASTGPATYEVRRRDTLSKIAAARGTTVADLRRANSLQSDVLRVGQVLAIPGAAAGGEPMQGETRTYAFGSVTVFSENNAGRVMADGAVYEPDAFVVAHRELPFGTVLIVENAETGRRSFARVAERGPVNDRHLIEISPVLASEIGISDGGTVRIRLVE